MYWEYYWASRREDALTQATPWTNHEDMTRSVRRAGCRRVKVVWRHTPRRPLTQANSTPRPGKRSSPGAGEGDGDLLVNGDTASAGEEKVPEVDGGEGCAAPESAECPRLSAWKWWRQSMLCSVYFTTVKTVKSTKEPTQVCTMHTREPRWRVRRFSNG